MKTLHVVIVSLGLLAASCKPQVQTSEVLGKTKTGVLSSTDMTTYKGANATVFTAMKKEMTKLKADYAALEKALGTKSLKGIQKGEAVAIRLYTSSAYTAINTKLRTKSGSSISSIKNIVKAASSGLNKLPAKPCTTQRGLDLPANVVDKILKVKRFEEGAFMSTAPTVPAAFKKNITFVIKSPRCVDIAFLSEFPNEKEILFPPGSDFVVTKSTLKKTGTTYKGMLYLDHKLSAAAFKPVTSGAKQNIVPLHTGVDKNDYPRIATAKPKSKTPAAKTPAKGKTKLLLTGESMEEVQVEDDLEGADYAEVDTEVPDTVETAEDLSGQDNLSVMEVDNEELEAQALFEKSLDANSIEGLEGSVD